MGEGDPFLRRLERDALIACGGLMIVALVVPGGGWRGAAGVGAGGLLAWVSYRGIKGGVDGVVRRGGRPAMLVKFFTRHAILAVAAYVILARLRLHPIAVIAGASSLVLAAAVGAARSFRRPGPEDSHG